MTPVDALIRLGAAGYYLNALTTDGYAWSVEDAVRVLNKAEELSNDMRRLLAHLEGALREVDVEAKAA